MTNILKPGYEQRLYYVIYNGPPNTIHADYRFPVRSGDEDSISAAIMKGCRIYKYIENPSEKVTIAAIKSGDYFLYEIKNPSRSIIMAIITKNEYEYKKYDPDGTFFTDKEKLCMIAENSDVIYYIKEPTDEMMDLAIASKPRNLLNVKQTVLRIALALVIFTEQTKNYFYIWCPLENTSWIDHIDYSDYYNNKDDPEKQRLFNEIVEILGNLKKIPKIPVEHLTDEQLIKCAGIDYSFLEVLTKESPERITSEICKAAFKCHTYNIELIPYEFQTKSMIDKILSDRNYARRLAKFLVPSPRVIDVIQHECDLENMPFYCQTQEICLREIKRNPHNVRYANPDLIDNEMLEIVYGSTVRLRYLPERFRDRRMCYKLIENNNYDLDCIPNEFIDDKLLDRIVKTSTGPRKERLDFVLNYPEDKLIAILKHRSYLLDKINPEKRTDNLLRSIVEWNGYSLQYLTREEQIKNNNEYVNIALSNQPRASKYVRTL